MSSKKTKIALVSTVISIYKFFSRKKTNKQNLNTIDFKNIVIYSTTALGDFMLNTPAIQAVLKRYPNAKITLVSSHKNRHLVESCPWFTQVLYWDQRIESAPGLIYRLRKQKPELSIILHSKNPYDALCATLSGSLYILKDDYSNTPSMLDRWFTVKTDGNFIGHLIKRKLALVSHLGCDISNVNMVIPINYKPAIHNEGEIIVGFQLGASDKLRCWPIARFQELARLLFTAGEKYRIELIGSPKETELSDSFLRSLNPEERLRVTNNVGTLSLVDLIEKIAGFDVLVTGDTGPLHLAIALRTHSISLFVTANPAHTGPLQDPNEHAVIHVLPGTRVLPEEYISQPMAMITAHEVMDNIEKIV